MSPPGPGTFRSRTSATASPGPLNSAVSRSCVARDCSTGMRWAGGPGAASMTSTSAWISGSSTRGSLRARRSQPVHRRTTPADAPRCWVRRVGSSEPGGGSGDHRGLGPADQPAYVAAHGRVGRCGADALGRACATSARPDGRVREHAVRARCRVRRPAARRRGAVDAPRAHAARGRRRHAGAAVSGALRGRPRRALPPARAARRGDRAARGGPQRPRRADRPPARPRVLLPLQRRAGISSPIGAYPHGAARRAPVGRMRFAFASCQNYPVGYFNAYADVAAQDLDLVVHLGDYIYERAGGQRVAPARARDGDHHARRLPDPPRAVQDRRRPAGRARRAARGS